MAAESGQEIEPHTSIFFGANPALVLEQSAAEYESLNLDLLGSYKVETGTFYLSPNPSQRFVMQGDIKYLDIFNEPHSVHWCWAHTYRSVYTESCTPTEADLLRR